jgi:hypothetical protein
MRPLQLGQDVVLSWPGGAADCRVLAAAGRFVLITPNRAEDAVPVGQLDRCTLTYLDGMVPMGWDGSVKLGARPGELRFRVEDFEQPADRRSSVRVPVFATAHVTVPGVGEMEAAVLDVSAGGMRLRHAGELLPGTRIHLRAEFDGAGGCFIDADAVVRTAQAGISSVEFTAMNAATPDQVGAWTVAVLRAALAGREQTKA